ncbi:MAG: NUDIX domain-containing protein [Patescibacteria group bacterium]|nr:NUDIX domain-containing protein [Patescibacteria group bacterium]
MKTNQTRPLVGVGVMVKNSQQQILIGLRKSLYGKGTWSFPGGHLEFGETMTEAAIRETEEETGLVVSNLELVSLADEMGSLDKGKHYVNVGFLAHSSSGEPQIAEPEKWEKWDWFDIHNLPSPLFEATDLMIQNYLNKNIYLNR